MLKFIAKEPTVFFGGLQAVLAAVLFALTAFDIWAPTEQQTTAVFGIYTALTAFIIIVIRAKVTPTSQIPDQGANGG